MDVTMEGLLRELDLRQGATQEAITALQKTLGTALPPDYLDFLRHSDGGIGHGPDLFVILDRAGEVAATTAGYGANEFVPGLIIFGSDGCGNVLGIDTRSHDPTAMDYMMFDACCLEWDEARHRSRSLAHLLECLAQTPRGGVD